MATPISEFDHSVLAVEDLNLAEHFYAQILGEIVGHGAVESRSMGTTDELLRAARLRGVHAEQRPDSAARVPAPHSGVTVGEAVIPLFLYADHIQEPPPEQMQGTPRLALEVTPQQMERAVEILGKHRVPFEGPVEHPEPCPVARSIYLKDPSSNFLELCIPR